MEQVTRQMVLDWEYHRCEQIYTGQYKAVKCGIVTIAESQYIREGRCHHVTASRCTVS